MGQEYDDSAQEGDVDLAEGQVDDRRDVGYEVNGIEMSDELLSSQEPVESKDYPPKLGAAYIALKLGILRVFLHSCMDHGQVSPSFL